MKIAWGITGGGHYLNEAFHTIENLILKKHNIEIFLSEAAEVVCNQYGILSKIEHLHKKFPDGLTMIYYGRLQKPGYPICAQFNLHVYDLLILSPLTANTAAKINVGIADTLITNIFSQMLKGSGNIYINPTDYHAGMIQTEIPGGKHISITIDQFNKANAHSLSKFQKVTLFERPNQILEKIQE